jgi:site-specific DNA recombinase
MRETLHLYSRVSTAIQEQGTSLEYQKELGEKCASDNELGFEVHNEGVHSSSSEDPMERDILRRLLARIENGEIKHLFVYNQDRLSRNEIAWTTIKVILMRHKVIPPFLMGLSCRVHAAVFSFIAGVMPPMPMLGRTLL